MTPLATLLPIGLAVALGAWLASEYMAYSTGPKKPGLSWLHGALGAIGVGLFAFVPHPPARGAHGFATIALVLLLTALAGGVTILILHQRRRTPGPLLIAMHATIAVAGALIAAAYIEAGR